MTLFDDKTLIKQQYLEGVTIFSEGDNAKEAYIIEEGEVRIFKNIGGEKKEIALFNKGDIFGEMALIRDSKHSSNAMATKRSNLVIITQKTLKDKLKNADPLITTLVHILAKRLHQTNLDRFGVENNDQEAEKSGE